MSGMDPLYFHMDRSALVQHKASVLIELDKVVTNIEQGKLEGEPALLLSDLVMIRLIIRKLDLSQSHATQLKLIQNLCSRIILGQPPLNAKPTYTQGRLLMAADLADRGIARVWKEMKHYFEAQAAQPQYTELCKLFSDMRVDPQLLVKVLLNAATKGHAEVVRLLLEDGRINKESRIQALNLAAENGHMPVVLLLIDTHAGSEVIVKACQYAAQKNHFEIVESLLNLVHNQFFPVPIDELVSILNKHPEGVKIIEKIFMNKHLRNDRRFGFSNHIALENAAERGHETLVTLLLQDKTLTGRTSLSPLLVSLFRACSGGHVSVVRLLLQDPRVHPSIDNDACIREAAAKGNKDIVAALLGCPRVKPLRAMQPAAKNGHSEVVELLLTCRPAEPQMYIDAVHGVIEGGHIDLATWLLAIPQATAEILNKALYLAIQHGREAIALLILRDERLNIDLAQVNTAFGIALERDHVAVIKLLLNERRFDPFAAMKQALNDKISINTYPGPKSFQLIIQDKRTQFLKVLAYALQNCENPTCQRFINLAGSCEIRVYGLPLSKIPNALKEFLKNPILYMESRKAYKEKSWESLKPFPVHIIAAVRILYTAFKVTEYKERLANAERDRNRFNNPDDEARIGAVRGHFRTVIQPHFAAHFTDVEAIEYRMRKEFLAQIIQEADAELLEFINALSAEETERLLQGNDEQLMEQAREYFSDSASAAQTAWRAYDRWAPVGGEWPNLLTPPLEDGDAAAYTVATVGLVRPTTEMASNLAREMVAYSFLLAMDESDGDEEMRATRKTAFIAKVAEIRRAHNAPDDEEDDPSCLPGTISRAGDMWIAHAKCIIPEATKLVEEELRTLVLEQFQKAPKSEQTDLHNALLMLSMYNPELKSVVTEIAEVATTVQTDLYNALVMLSSLNAQECINGQVPFSEEQNKRRQGFIDSLGSLESLKTTLDQRLIARGSRALSNQEFAVFIPALLADIGGPWMAPQLTAIFRSAKKLENPFAYAGSQNSISAQEAIGMLMKLLCEVEVENKMNFMWDTAKLIAQGKILDAQAKLELVGVSSEALHESLAAVDTARAHSQEKRAQKAALWEQLNSTLQNNPLPDKDELLKEIVDEVIDGNLALEEVLHRRGIA